MPTTQSELPYSVDSSDLNTIPKGIKTESSSMKKARRPYSKNGGGYHHESHQVLPMRIHEADIQRLRSSNATDISTDLHFMSHKHLDSRKHTEPMADDEYQTNDI